MVLDSKVESLKHPYLRKVNHSQRFYLKADHDNILSEIVLLEDLAETLSNSSEEAISFHTQTGNDFAVWVHEVVGDEGLADSIRNIEYADPTDARDKMVSAIRERVDFLKC